jgi:NAD(P)-dependent dehydrogenase (short-subunit alcohol dehydrogenase family)
VIQEAWIVGVSTRRFESGAVEDRQVALRWLGTLDDCAEVVELLAIDLSDYGSGAVIPIDGGLLRACPPDY